jgi:hypothetical protein
MKRRVLGLRWAKTCERPRSIPVGRPRGAKAAGIRYERAIAQELRGARRGQWFEFEDLNGPGYCQVDFLLPWAHQTAVLEAKYTWTGDGHRELEWLYVPVVEAAGFACPVGIVISRRLVPQMGARVAGTLEEAFEGAKCGPSVLHWIGAGPLVLRAAKAHGTGTCIAAPLM